LLILIISGGLRAFDHMYIMTGGGPGNATSTLTYMMYKSAYVMNNFGYACAVAISLVLECLCFTLLINRFVARERLMY
ncbi:MAG: carbohydrate ABC transporter permease, partial [Lachnoanaerobaculum gingivalis]